MHDRNALFQLGRLAGITLLAVCATVAAAAPAAAQTAETRYERTLARETKARSQRAPALSELRAIATAYEQIPRRYPRSGYADNALWQAAGVLQLAYEQGRSARDRDKATTLLAWLRKEYPSSSLIKGVPGRLAELQPPARATARAAAAPSGGASRPAPTPAATRSPTAPVALPSSSVPTASERQGPGRAESAPPVARAPAPSTAATPTPAAFPSPAADRPVTTAVEPSATLPAVAAGSAPVVAKSIAYTKLPRGDRIILELTSEVPFTANLSADADQLLVSLTGVVAPNPVVAAADTIRGTFVTSLALDRPAAGRTQLAIRLKTGSRYSTYPLYDPYRLVVDFEAEPAVPDPGGIRTSPSGTLPSPTHVAAAPASPAAQPTTDTDDAPEMPPTPAPPASTSRGDFSLARQLGLGVSRIVIDPGHGGHDPGAQANGVSESELVLDVALRLEKLLAAQPGFEVVLTRRKNQFVALEERTAIANRETADLFLSIHANSSPNRDTRGIETYFLNFATNAAAEAVAARENASSAQAMHLLPELVQAIATSDKVAESRELATMVQTSLMRRVGALNKSIKDLGVKQAPFVVLIGAKMPSVLAEVSFLTNKTEASLLKQANHRQRIAQALADAVLRYQASLKKVTGVSARSEGR